MRFKEFVKAAGLQERTGQVKMADAVSSAIKSKTPAIIEGGTGNGKTYAYLMPVIEHLHNDPDSKAVISTSTKLLQDQLMSKDIPDVLKAYKKKYGDKFRINMSDVSKMIGAGNYLCEDDPVYDVDKKGMEAVKLAIGDEMLKKLTKVVADMRKTKSVVMRSDLDGMGVKLPHELWQEMSCKGIGGCKCHSQEKTCSFGRNYKHAMDSKIIITNHSYLAMNVAASKKSDIIVIDEAHKLPEVLGKKNSSEVNLSKLKQVCEAFMKKTSQTVMSQEIDTAISSVRLRLHDVIERIGLVEARVAEMSKEQKSLSVEPKDGDGMTQATVEYIFGAASEGDVEKKYLAILKDLSKLSDSIKDQFDPGRKIPAGDVATLQTMSKAVGYIKAGLAKLDNFLAYRNKDSMVWFEKGTRSIHMVTAPLNHLRAQAYQAKIIFDGASPIFMSATLGTDSKAGDFTHFKRSIGFKSWSPKLEPIELIVPSAFDFSSQSMLAIPNDIPQPSYDKDEAGKNSTGTKIFFEAVSKSIADNMKQVDGNCLVLCSSLSQVAFITEHLSKAFKDDDSYAVMSQLNDGSLERIVRKMRSGIEPKKVLIGMQSLWQGVDLQGEALRGLFIVKLPFSSPDHPLEKKRQAVWQEIYKKPYFTDVSLPAALTLLRQGAGRLIRSGDKDTEYGVVVFYDPRMALPEGKRKSYVNRVFDAFPKDMPVIFGKLDDIPGAVKTFFDDKNKSKTAGAQGIGAPAPQAA